MQVVALFVVALGLACGGVGHPRQPVPRRDTYVRLERTECLGTCPVYAVTIFDDGALVYEGKQHAPPGAEQRNIPPAQVERIMEAVDRVQPWTCEPDRITTDYPQSIVTLSRRGQLRRIVHDHGDPCAPDAIRRVESDIDVAAGQPRLMPDVYGE